MHRCNQLKNDPCKVSELIRHFETLSTNVSIQQSYSDAKKLPGQVRRRTLSHEVPGLKWKENAESVQEMEGKVNVRYSLPESYRSKDRREEMSKKVDTKKSMLEKRRQALSIFKKYEKAFIDSSDSDTIKSTEEVNNDHTKIEKIGNKLPKINNNHSKRKHCGKPTKYETKFKPQVTNLSLSHPDSLDAEPKTEAHFDVPEKKYSEQSVNGNNTNQSEEIKMIYIATAKTVLGTEIGTELIKKSDSENVPALNNTSLENNTSEQILTINKNLVENLEPKLSIEDENSCHNFAKCKPLQPKSISNTSANNSNLDQDEEHVETSLDLQKDINCTSQNFNQLKLHTNIESFSDPQTRCDDCVFDENDFKYTCLKCNSTVPEIKLSNFEQPETKISEEYSRIDSSYFSNDDEDYDDFMSMVNDDYVVLRPHSKKELSTVAVDQVPHDSRFQENDMGYCTLRPISSSCRQISGRHDSPIYEDLKILSKVEHGSNNNSSEYSLYKELTILDKDKNVRIKTVSKIPIDCVNPLITVAASKDQKEYIIDELINTEETYIYSLEFVIKTYLVYFSKLFINEPRRYKHIFANIEHIYDQSKAFFQDLNLCKYNSEDIAGVFLKHEPLFNLYPTYCKNKKVSSDLIQGEFKDHVAKRDLKVDDGLGLSSHLLRPIQRLAKYELLLEKLSKTTESNGMDTTTIERAIALIQNVAREGNDLIILESIENNPFTLQETGKFVIKDDFKMISPQKIDIALFLFKNMIIFAVKTTRDIDTFSYRTHIEIKALSRMTDDSLLLSLEDFFMRKKQKDPKFVLEAKDMKTKNKWIERIDKMLWEQLQECKDKITRKHSNIDPIPIPVDQAIAENYNFELYPREKTRKSHFFVSLKR